MMDLKKLCEESLECARSKGWLDKPRTKDEHANLMISEISEALEEYRKGKPLAEMYWPTLTREAGPPGMVFTFSFSGLGYNGPFPEVSEHKPEGIPVEIADFFIRACQYAGEVGEVDGLLEGYQEAMAASPSYTTEDSLSEVLFEMTKSVVLSSGILPASGPSSDNLDAFWLGDILAEVERWCEAVHIDLPLAISIKAAYNLTRPHRHGGKVI